MANNNTEKIVMFDTENSIILGDYLDLLLNRAMDPREAYGDNVTDGVYVKYTNEETQNTTSRLGQYEYILYANKSEKLQKDQIVEPDFIYIGGIRIPHYHGTDKIDEGSGNIVISGKPGVGKSTMAFQFAAACASELNHGIAVYFSLDVEEKQIVKSMRHIDSELRINYLCDYPSAQNREWNEYDAGSNEELEAMFRNVLYKDKSHKIIPQIVFPKLSPRGISPDTSAKEDFIFLQRIDELQKLLRAISTYNMRERTKEAELREPFVKLVVIDSLDVFGERTLTREEINRLFMLFKQYGIIGIFTMGFVGYEFLNSEAAYKTAVTYQADVVIELKREFYNNYTCSYFEIIKSRHVRHVLGHHPYKVENYPIDEEEKRTQYSFPNKDLIKKILVFPSLHYRISASENSGPRPEKEKSNKEIKSLFGIDNIVKVMPNHFKERSMEFPQIITISGKSGLFKSDIALNALLSGIVDYGERGLIVRLGDRDAFTVRGMRFEKELLERTKKYSHAEEENKVIFYEKGKNVIHNDEPNKYTLKGWSIIKDQIKPQLLEVTFKNGALLPEEFVDEICKIINLYGIRRVVFTDLKYIGSSYPFLVNSDTSGNLFLSAFVHIMRNYGMHVIMSSSKSGLNVSDVELSKAGILADAILTCRTKINQNANEVYIEGEGLITNTKNNKAKFIIEDTEEYQLQFYSDSEGNSEHIQSVIKLVPFSIELLNAKTNSTDSIPK
jgi:KaiC./DnaB-like helicase C terminal domain.